MSHAFMHTRQWIGLTLFDLQDPQGLHQTTCFGAQTVFWRVKCSLQPEDRWEHGQQHVIVQAKRKHVPKLHEVVAAILASAHLGVYLRSKLCQSREKQRRLVACTYHSAVFTLAVDVMHLCDEALARNGGIQDMVEVNGQDAEEPFLARRSLHRGLSAILRILDELCRNLRLYM